MALDVLLAKTGLAILKGLISSGVGHVIKKDLFSADGTENDQFRRIMREAFVDAVKATRSDSTDTVQIHYQQDEFRYYHNALLQELLKIDKVERKTYIEKDLYYAFKEALLNREEALAHISMAMADECLNQLQQSNLRIDNLESEMAAVKSDMQVLTEIVKQQVQLSPMSPAKMIETTKGITISIPSLYSERKDLVEKIVSALNDSHIALLYAGIKEGKTVTSELLSHKLSDSKIVWLDFAYSNSFDVDAILGNYHQEEKILFVFDSVRYDDDAVCERFCQTIISHASINWNFIITSYSRFSEIVYSDVSAIAELEVVPLTQVEVEEMIPEDKRSVYGSLIYSLFSGQPLLSNMACAYLKQQDWAISAQEIGHLFTFPKGTPLEKKIARTARQFVHDEEEYRLMNRLLLFDRPFTVADSADMASITPVILNSRAHLNAMAGAWFKEDNGLYTASPLLRKAMAVDLLPQELADCSLLIARKIIRQPQGITPLDASRVLMLLTNTKDENSVTSFYINSLYKLDEEGLLDGESAFVWRMFWVNVSLPEWLNSDSKVLIRVAQLALLVSKHRIEPYNIAADLEEILYSMSDRSMMKAAGMRALVAYHLLEGETQKALSLQQQSRQLLSVPELKEIDDEKVLLLSINKVSTVKELIEWGEQYASMGNPEIELIGEGVILAISRILKDKLAPEIVEITASLCALAAHNRLHLIAIVACARWIGALQEDKRYEEAGTAYELYSYLTGDPFGRLLINYSYGLCLVQQGLTDEAERLIADACSVEDIALSAADAMNARCKLAQLYGDRRDYDGALAIILNLLKHKDFSRLYTDYEQGMIRATMGYAYWMAGKKELAVKELLNVEQLLWVKHSQVDYNFKNLSIRFSILVLDLCSTLEGNKVREDFLPADYETFTKVYSWIEDEYKPLRNFTSLYPMYEMSERILHDDAVSLRMVEHMIAYQQTEGKDHGNLLTIMMQAYPICLCAERYDLFEYIVLKSLSSSVNAIDDRPVNYEELILINAIQSFMMFRTCRKVENKFIDDDIIFGLIQKAKPYLPNHDKTDAMESQMLSEQSDYSQIPDIHCQYITHAYHLNDISVPDSLVTIYVLTISLISTNKMPSAISLAEQFAYSYAMMTIRSHTNLFSSTEKEMEQLFTRLGQCHGKEYIRGILQGLHFKIKVEPVISKEMKVFMELV